MATRDELYELVNPVRVERMRYEVVDRSGAVEGEIHPTTIPTLGVNIANDVKRTCTGLELANDEARWLDPMGHRIQAHWELPEATDTTSTPAGLFVFANLTDLTTHWTANLHDLGALMQFERGESFGIDDNETWTEALARLMGELPIPGVAIEPSSQRPLSPYTQPGNTSRTKIVNDICAAVGYWWSFDPVGSFSAAPARDPRVVEADFEYAIPGADRSKVAANSVVRSNDLLVAHNRYKVVSAGANQAAVVGQFDIPDEAPHSIARRGIVVPQTVQIQGIDSQGAADFWAFVLSLVDDQSYERIEFDAPWDARLGVYNVISHADVTTLCQSWSGPAAAGGPMHLNLARKVWAA